MSRAGTRSAAALLAALALAACAGLGLDAADSRSVGEGTEATAGNAAEASGPDLAAGLPVPPGLEADTPSDAEAAPDASTGEGRDPEVATAGPATPQDSAAAAAAPHVYMALQPETGGTISVVFAIDRSRDNTPSDEPAIRITPEETEAQSGRCNPQQLRYYRFPPESAAAPVYGPDEASRGVGARDLPGFMATAVSSEMMERGIADELEETRPQNVCTRKLFEQTIIAATTGQG